MPYPTPKTKAETLCEEFVKRYRSPGFFDHSHEDLCEQMEALLAVPPYALIFEKPRGLQGDALKEWVNDHSPEYRQRLLERIERLKNENAELRGEQCVECQSCGHGFPLRDMVNSQGFDVCPSCYQGEQP